MSSDIAPMESPHSIQLKGSGAFQGLFDIGGLDAALSKTNFDQERLMNEVLTLVTHRDMKVKAQGLALLMRMHSYAEKRRHQPITVTAERRYNPDAEGNQGPSIIDRISVRGHLGGIPEACTVFKPIEILSRAPRTEDYIAVDARDPTSEAPRDFTPEAAGKQPDGPDVGSPADFSGHGTPVPLDDPGPERPHDAGLSGLHPEDVRDGLDGSGGLPSG